MKNFEIKCTYTQQHDTTEAFTQQVVELVLHLDLHSWRVKEGWAATEYTDGDGDLCIDLQFTFTSPGVKHDGTEIDSFLSLCGELCGDSVRIYGGGSGPNLRAMRYKKDSSAYQKWKDKYYNEDFKARAAAARKLKADKYNARNRNKIKAINNELNKS